jgi:hypothetical protein
MTSEEESAQKHSPSNADINYGSLTHEVIFSQTNPEVKSMNSKRLLA